MVLVPLLLCLAGFAGQASIVYAGHDATIESLRDYNAAVSAYSNRDYTKAYEEFKKLAEQGYARGQYNLALIYLVGEGVAQDYVEGLKWLRKAAEQEKGKDDELIVAQAQFYLGGMYAEGRGVPKDDVEAAKWLRMAADSGISFAQFQLAEMYHDGAGVPKDYVEAAKWYRKAAEQGDATAQVELAELYKGVPGVPQNYAEVVKWYRKAAEQGNTYGQIGLGARYAYGEGVLQDFVQAYMWYNLAAVNSPPARTLRDELAELMTPAQIAEAQRLAREWKAKGGD